MSNVDADPAVDREIDRLREEHGHVLLGWARNRFADPRDAEEVVADTLVRAWRGREQYDPDRGSERSWIFGIARNCAVDHYRRSRRHQHSLPTSEPPEHLVDDQALARLLDASTVAEALAALSEEHRTAIVEAYYEGRTAVEIGRRHDLPPGTVRSRLYYGLRRLRTELEERGVLR